LNTSMSVESGMLAVYPKKEEIKRSILLTVGPRLLQLERCWLYHFNH
jgi:hypothetical protein